MSFPPDQDDATPVRDMTAEEQSRLRSVRDVAAAHADRDMAMLSLAEAQREIARLKGENLRLERRNDELLCAEVERDELRADVERMTIEILHLKRALSSGKGIP